MYWPIICPFLGAKFGNINRFSLMFSLHTQLARDAGSEKLQQIPSWWACALHGGMLHCGPLLELRGSGQFNGVQWKWFQSYAVVSTATSRFWRAYLWPHVLPFLPANFSPVTPKVISLLSLALSLKLLARSGCEVGSCSRFIVGICINFLVTSCIHLSLVRFHRLFTFYFVFIK